jgi:transcriptional regulator
MFLPSVHAETDKEVLLQFIKENPLGLLITGQNSAQVDFLQCTHVPCVLDLPEEYGGTEPRIRAHIAKQNPQVKAMIEAVDEKPPNVLELDNDVLVLFNGKHDHYVTPKYYTETKPTTGKVVPTWNYSAVQVYGKLSLYYDSKTPEAGAFLAQQVHDLSQHTETTIMGYTGGDKPQPWTVSEAPESYTDLLKRNIVGIEIQITKIEGKFKMSQEMRPGDREGVAQGFVKMGTETGTAISELVKERAELSDLKKNAAKAGQ